MVRHSALNTTRIHIVTGESLPNVVTQVERAILHEGNDVYDIRNLGELYIMSPEASIVQW